MAQLTDSLTSEEDDAWAIYVPPNDVTGATNADGHEVDFFTRDGKQQPYFWAYSYDATAHTLHRYRFAAPGGAVTSDVDYANITKFYAHTYPITALQDPAAAIFSSLYAGAALQSGVVHFYPSMPWIAGGNDITYVHVEGPTLKRDLELATRSAPSGFTVVLNYTPSPAPSSTPGALSVWPPAVRYPVSGTMLASSSAVPTLAERVNALFGGGIARAAGCGTAIAYADATFARALANATDPYDATVTTDGSGCMSSSVISLYEPGYNAPNAFVDQWRQQVTRAAQVT